MLLSVSVKNCNIDYLYPGSFRGNSFVSVRVIDISNNVIELVVGGAFQDLQRLHNISMDNNLLQTVQEGAFKNLPEAYAINLSRNAINKIEEGAFDNLPLLKVLDLSHNELTTIPGEISELPSLQMLYLNGNHWNCSCGMSWVLNSSLILASSQAVCEHPADLKGVALHQLTRWHFMSCFTFNSLIHVDKVIIVVSLAVFVLALGAFFKHLIGSNMKRYRRIEYNLNDTLSKKNNIFRGKFRDGTKYKHNVAIKVHHQKLNPREVRVLLRLQEAESHPNVIRYWGFEEDLKAKITYIALNLCGGNLKDAIINQKEKFLPYLTPDCCLMQTASGVQFLHGLQVQHGDIKPQNVLWKEYGNEMKFVISDFDLSHINNDEFSSRSLYGTLGWMAPELLQKIKPDTEVDHGLWVDIFSLGCVFYFVLTVGKHPFGPMSDMMTCQQNINDGCYFLGGLNEHLDNFVAALAEDLVEEMITSERPKVIDVLKHPLFWNKSEVMQYYIHIGDCLRDLKGSSAAQLKQNLQDNATKVFQGSWRTSLDNVVLKDIRPSSFNEFEICDLLKVVRNKSIHFGELPEVRKTAYLGSQEGVAEYYNKKFPMLLPHTYRAEQRVIRDRD